MSVNLSFENRYSNIVNASNFNNFISLMFTYLILCVLALNESDPIVVVYPDVKEKVVSFDFYVDEDFCEFADNKHWALLKEDRIIFEEKIKPVNGKFHIKSNKVFPIQRLEDFGYSTYWPSVCYSYLGEQAKTYIVQYRPNLTLSIDSREFKKDEIMIIDGTFTDWDSANLDLSVKINDETITTLHYKKEFSEEEFPYSVSFPLDKVKLGRNNLIVTIRDRDGLSSTQTREFFIEGIKPVVSFANNTRSSYSVRDEIKITMSVEKHEVADFLDVFYAIDYTGYWSYATKIDLKTIEKTPFDIFINSTLPEGKHRIYIKCIDSNGIQSEKYLVKDITIETEIIIKSENSYPSEKQSSLTAGSLIAAATACLALVFIIAAMGLFLFRSTCQEVPSESSTVSINRAELFSITINFDETIVDNPLSDNATIMSFSSDEEDNPFKPKLA